jgi:uroporphyrin-III C-methyltransferase
MPWRSIPVTRFDQRPPAPRWRPPAFAAGSVWLVGAGPGDPGLLTQHAVHALAEADTIVYDALVDGDILSFARMGAKLCFAGKRGGKPSPKQPAITELLIREAQDGQRVLRLKGGDPFLFGRGGEEALALAAAGIPFRVVPGVTSGIAAPAYAGIPVSHRDVGSAITFVAGHAADGAVPSSLDWQALAKGAPVLVFYMALKHLPEIVAKLIAGGRLPSEPVAAIQDATTRRQRVLESTLGSVVADVAAAGIEPPAIIVVGGVVSLRASLAWLGVEPAAEQRTG